MMSIEIFTKEKFESSLPIHKETQQPVWEYTRLNKGEHCYYIPITVDIGIAIRSSVMSNGYSADTGQDSIRCWLVSEGKPLGSKVSKYITRVPGWDKRLIDTLRTLWEWARLAGYCDKCNVPKGVFKVKKNGKNKGRIFCKCRQCNDGWGWLT